MTKIIPKMGEVSPTQNARLTRIVKPGIMIEAIERQLVYPSITTIPLIRTRPPIR